MKILKINGTPLDKQQLEVHLQKVATNHNLTEKSQKNTYPVPHLLESFRTIQEVYNLLNKQVLFLLFLFYPRINTLACFL